MTDELEQDSKLEKPYEGMNQTKEYKGYCKQSK
jgi:hypothetical protein